MFQPRDNRFRLLGIGPVRLILARFAVFLPWSAILGAFAMFHMFHVSRVQLRPDAAAGRRRRETA